MSPPLTRPPVPHAAATPTIATAIAPARSGRGNSSRVAGVGSTEPAWGRARLWRDRSGKAQRTRASLTRSACGPGGCRRGRLRRLELLLGLLGLAVGLGGERRGRVLGEE